MKSDAIKKIFSKFKKKKIPYRNWLVLEFFARDGSWHTNDYNNFVKKIIAWEINKKFRKDFKKNVPNSEFIVGDSFKILKRKKYFDKFNLIILDNPQYFYGKNKQYCEHFEAIELIKNLFVKGKAYLIFNINKRPFNYNKLNDWKKKRDEYYGFNSTKISSTKIITFYKKKFQGLGYKVFDCFEEKRNDRYLSYLVFSLKK